MLPTDVDAVMTAAHTALDELTSHLPEAELLSAAETENITAAVYEHAFARLNTTDDPQAVSMNFDAQHRLEAMCLAAEYGQIFRSYMQRLVNNGVTLHAEDMTFEGLTTGKCSATYRQAEEALKVSGQKKSQARKIFKQALMVHLYAPEMLGSLVTGTLRLPRFRVILKKVLEIESPQGLPANPTPQERDEYRDTVSVIDSARRHFTKAALERSDADSGSAADDGLETDDVTEFDVAKSEAQQDRVFSDDVNKLLDTYQPDTETERALRAAAKRYVSFQPGANSMTTMHLHIPAESAYRFKVWLERGYKAVLAAGLAKGRSHGQILADLAVIWFETGIAVSTAESDAATDGAGGAPGGLNSAVAELGGGRSPGGYSPEQQAMVDNAIIPGELLANVDDSSRTDEAGDACSDTEVVEEHDTLENADATVDDAMTPGAPEVPETFKGPEDSADDDANPGKVFGRFPGMKVNLVLQLTLKEHLALGGVVTPNLLPVLEEIDPEFGRLARRNLKYHEDLVHGLKNAPPDWLENMDDSFRLLGSDAALTPRQAWKYLRNISAVTTLLCDPVDMYPIGFARNRYKPDDTTRLLVELRDVRCRAPGCNVRAADCELDHLLEYVKDRGLTAYFNLIFLCPNHHAHKSAGWYDKVLRTDLGDGVVEFINTRDQTRAISWPDRPLHPVAYRHLLAKAGVSDEVGDAGDVDETATDPGGEFGADTGQATLPPF